MVNAWPFQWRQVDTLLGIYIYIPTFLENCIALVGGPQRGALATNKAVLFDIQGDWYSTMAPVLNTGPLEGI